MESKLNQPEWMQVAEIDLVYKSKIKAADRPKINSSKDAYDIFQQLWDTNKLDLLEQVKVLLLNRNNRVLGIYHLSSGGITSTVVDPKLIFAAALKAMAVGIVLSHNHPSGSLTPSTCDIELTKKIKASAAMLDIQLLDHLIITSESYYSFADEGLL